MAANKADKRPKHKTIAYAGYSIRRLPNGMWQTDNNLPDDPVTGEKRRRRKCFTTLDAAKAYAKGQSGSEKTNGRQIYLLKETDRTAAARAIQQLGPDATLDEAIKFWKRHHPDAGAAMLGETTDIWLAKMIEKNLRPATVRDYRHKIRKFVDKLGKDKPVAAITDDAVKSFIQSLGVSTLSRKGWKTVLGTFFRYCQKEKILKHNPAWEADIELAIEDEKAIAIMPPSTVRKFMHKAEELYPEAVAALAIQFFAGLRPTEMQGQYGLEDSAVTAAKTKAQIAHKRLADAKEHGGAQAIRLAHEAAEAARLEVVAARAAAKKSAKGKPALLGGLQWEDIRLHADADEQPTIYIGPNIAKKRRQRYVDITDNLLQWLMKYRKHAGPVAPSPRAFRRIRKAIAKAAELDRWTPDVTRHSFASYHYALHKDIGGLQAQMGHTGDPDVLVNHYRKAATKADAKVFWAILPEDKDKQCEKHFQMTARGA